MDENTSVVLVALIAIVVPVLNWWQNRNIAKQVAYKVIAEGAKAAEQAANLGLQQNQKLDHIAVCVNSRLTDALDTIEDLKALLLLALSTTISPDDQRIREVLDKAERVL